MKTTKILTLAQLEVTALRTLLHNFGLQLAQIDAEKEIPGSFWGEPEAGLIGNILYARADTPLHSILHEAGHYICMPPARRAALHTNAGGDYDEENGVCYLQILLAEQLPGMNREKMYQDMDGWGYSFRLGSTQAWFEGDAEEAITWLRQYELLDQQGQPTGKIRT